MGRIHQNLPPPGTAIAIAFSGGLDTRTAVAWLNAKGLPVYAYTANLAQPDESDLRSIPDIACEYGAKSAVLLDCQQELVKEGFLALQCGAFHIHSAGRKYFNTTPLGRAVTTIAIIRAMRRDKVNVFSDGSTYKGNDILRFYRYGVLFHPELQVYKPWLDPAFVEEFGGRQEMSQFLNSIQKPYPTSSEKAYSTDANILGATHEAKNLEYLDQSLHIVEPLMGIPYWKEDCPLPQAERVSVEFQRGLPLRINDQEFSDAVGLLHRANEIGGRHGLGMSDQVENRVIEAKSRGIYEAPGLTLLHICYERLLSITHSEAMLNHYFSLGRRLGRLLYEGKWYEPEATMLKDTLSRWIASPINGRVELELHCGDNWIITGTKAEKSSYNPEKLSMEKTKQVFFSPTERIGSLEMEDLNIMDNRNLLRQYSYLAKQNLGAELQQLLQQLEQDGV